MNFNNKNILVVGLGISGFASACWLASAKAKVTVTDIREEREIDKNQLGRLKELGIAIEAGVHRLETFRNSDLIIVSPGVPLDIEPLNTARESSVPIIGELELAHRILDIPMIAVTGTNGKSTATSLIGEMMANAGFEIFVGGNIGTPVINLAAGPVVTGLEKTDFAVLEVSSFQLDSADTFCPSVSLLMNISPDHLDRYPDYEAYIQSKLKIFRHQGTGHYAVLNDDDEVLARVMPEGELTVLRYGMEKKENRNAFVQGNEIFALLPGCEPARFDIKGIKLPGRHNIENAMGCILVGLSLNIRKDVIEKTLKGFNGLPNRLEFVDCINGVDFYNDSKATNVDAAVKAISSFAGPVLLIAGGRHKGGDYMPIVEEGKGKIKKALLIGESKQLIADAMRGHIPWQFEENLDGAVGRAYSASNSGDTVLLAPACSSFDMFESYSHRGRVFRKAVKELKNG